MEDSNTPQKNVLIDAVKPEDTLVSMTFGKYNVSIGKILELKSKDSKMGYRKIGAALGVNYKVIQRAYNSYLKLKGNKDNPGKMKNLEEGIYSPSYRDHSLGRNFVIGQMIVSGYVDTELKYKGKTA